MAAYIDYRHPAYNTFSDEWQLVTDCVDGERAVKAAREKYLPHPSDNATSEDPVGERYKNYLARAPFLNATGRSLNGLIGIAFDKPVTVTISGFSGYDLEADADGEGQPLTQLIRDALSQNLQRGRAGLLADYTGHGEQTEATRGRPVIRLYTAKQIINWRVTDGKTSLVVIEYEEPVKSDGFELEMKTKWKELRLIDDLAHAREWWKEGNEFISSDWIILTDAKGNKLTELPWSWIGANNNDHTPDTPPLADLAYMNIKHYHIEADIAESSHLVGQPMIFVSGLTTQWVKEYMSDGINVGSRKAILLPQGGEMNFAQTDERSLQITVAERREKQMAMLGAKLVERNTSARTATQASDEAQTDNSVLSLCAGNVEQAFNRAIQFCVQFAGAGEASVELNKRYEIAQLDSASITALLGAVQSGKMRLTDFVAYLQKIGVVSEEQDPEEIADELGNQEPELLE